MNIIVKKVFCVAFTLFVLFLAGCQQKEHTPSEEELASTIEKRLLNAKRGALIVFSDNGKIITGLIVQDVNPHDVATEDAGNSLVRYRRFFNFHEAERMFMGHLKYQLLEVIYPDNSGYEKFAKKFTLQQVGIYETDD